MIKLAISGCQGRMGQRITYLASEDKTFKITTLLEHKNHPKADESIHGVTISTDADAIKGCKVLIEFTMPEATIENLAYCVKHKVGMVIGTTGLTPEQVKKIKTASKKIPIVFSSNMSVGVNLVFKLLEITGSVTKKNYTINIVEAHHIHKKDAPSGTAKTMMQIAKEASGQDINNVESIREGEIIGDHRVIFESGEDRIEIFHHAKTRDIFAKGALIAVKFVANKKHGLFNMQNVLGLS